MDTFITVSGLSEAEYTEKRSRFIATLSHTETEEAAAAFIAEMRSKYWDARHNCFAYSVENGRLKRFSDDSEPHGTAGRPILDVIEGAGITDCTVVVTRYFGGVLLGTGGLVRAYSSAAKGAVMSAQRVRMTPCTVYVSRCGYSERDRLLKLIGDCGGTVESIDYAAALKVTYFLETAAAADFTGKLRDIFSARIEAEIKEVKMLPVKI